MALKISIVALIAVSLMMAFVIGEIRRETVRLSARRMQRLTRDRRTKKSRLRRSERDGGEEDSQASIVARGDAAPVFETAKHDLDKATASIPAFAVFDGDDAAYALPGGRPCTSLLHNRDPRASTAPWADRPAVLQRRYNG
jgi:hypothetical protein